jgi:hypothetical protein
MKQSAQTTARTVRTALGVARPRTDVGLTLGLAVAIGGLALGLVGLALVGPAVAAENATQAGLAGDDGNVTRSGSTLDANDTQSGPDYTRENVTHLYGEEEPVEHNRGMPDLVRTPDGGLIAIRADINETYESTILRLDAEGKVVSKSTVSGVLQDVERVGDDSYAATGLRDDDALVVWMDGSGTVTWNTTYGGEKRDMATDIASAPDGDAYVLASTDSFGVNTSDLWVVRVDATGAVVWDRLVEHETWTAFPEGVRLEDGSLIATIRTERSMDKEVDGRQNVSVARLAPDGSVSWRTVVAGPGQPNDKEEMFDVIPAHGDGVLIAGASNSGNGDGGNFDFWTARLDSDGAVLWQRQYEGATREFLSAAVRTDDGYVLAGFAERDEAPGVMGKLVAIDEDGSERSTTTFAQIPRFTNRFLGADWTADGRLAVSGTTVNDRDDGILSGAWIVDMSDAAPELDPGPSIWETQHPDASVGDGDDGESVGDDGDSGGDSDAAVSDADAAASAREPAAGASSADVVLFAATALSVVALFVPYGVRRLGRR